MLKVTESKTFKDVVVRSVRLEGLTDIMFDRYPGDNRTQLEPYQRLYVKPGTNEICLPSINIISALTAENTNSFPRVLMDARKYKGFCRGVLSFTSISPAYINFLRDGKKILLGSAIDGDCDPQSGVYLHRTVARLEKGIPNPKVRPTLPAPWALEFTLSIFPNEAFTEQELQNIITQGGIAMGLGTFRGAFGKFRITQWK